MATIDERVVSLKFNNGQFQKATQDSMDALGQLKSSLNLSGSTKGLNDLGAAAKKVDMSGIADGVDTATSKFSAMKVAGLAALGALAVKATTVGLSMAADLGRGLVQEAKEGLSEYELKLGSIQTILANTSHHGTGLEDVNKSLNTLNEYADRTIYNFGDMTRNIGLFTNAGIKIEDATAMIKGFSNEAASSGTSAAGAAGAAYQLSQALSSGKVTLMDWKSLTNVGMGSANMKNGILDIATAMGTFEGKSVTAKDAQKDFNSTLSEGWLTADVMQNYLKIQAGELSEAQMKAIGLSGDQITAFQKQATIAQDAATKVRSLTQLMDTLAEAKGSGWAKSWEIAFGDFNEATELFTGLYNIFDPLIAGSADARNKMLQDWKDAGGRDRLVDGLLEGLKAATQVMDIFKKSSAEVFPKGDGPNGLTKFTEGLSSLIETLTPTKDQLKLLGEMFETVMRVFKIGGQVVGGFLGVIGDFLGSLFKTTPAVGDFTQNLTGTFEGINSVLENSQWITDFFEGFGNVISTVIPILRDFGLNVFNALSGLTIFDNFGSTIIGLGKGIGKVLGSIGEGFANITGAGFESTLGRITGRFESLVDFMNYVGEVVSNVMDMFQPLFDELSKMLDAISTNIANAFDGADFNTGLDLLNTGLLAGLVILVRKFFKDILGIGDGAKESLLDTVKGLVGDVSGVLDNLGGTLQAMQTNLKADTLIKIAGAIALLTASVVVLSLIDSAKLTQALVAMTVMFTQLGVSMKVFEAITMTTDMKQMVLLGFSLTFIAGAILILSVALKIISTLSFGEIIKGLVGVVGLLLGLAKAAEIMGKNAANLISTGIGLMFVAVAVNIMASALKKIGELSFGEIVKGLIGVAGILAASAMFTRMVKVNKGAIGTAAGLIVLGLALKVMASAIEDFAAIDNGSLIKGFGTLTAVLLALSLFSNSTKNVGNMFSMAAGMVVLGAAMKVMASALSDLGSMDIATIGKGLLALSVSLLAIAIAMRMLPPNMLVLAAGLLVVAVSLKVLASSLEDLGSMSWEEIAKSLITLAGALIIVAAAMLVMTGTIAGSAALMLFAVALTMLLPVIMALGSMPIDTLAIGIVALAVAIVALMGAVALGSLLMTPVIGVFMAFGVAMALIGASIFLVSTGTFLFAAALATLAGVGVLAVPVLIQIIKSLIDLIPYALEQFGLGVVLFAGIIVENIPIFVDAMVQLLLSLLNAINTLAPEIANTLWILIQELLALLVNAVPAFVDAGMKIIVGVLQGIASQIDEVVIAALDIVIAFLDGIASRIGAVIEAGVDVIIAFLEGIQDNIPRLAQEGWDTVIAFVDGITNSINDNMGRLRESGKKLAFAIADGMSGGLLSKVGEVAARAREMASNAVNSAKNFLGINSPSKVFTEIGEWTGEGFGNGMDNMGGAITKSAKGMGENALSAMKSSMKNASSVVNDNIDSTPVIRPVLDLTDVTRGSEQLSRMMKGEDLKASLSEGRASSIFRDEQDRIQEERLRELNRENNNTPSKIEFTQINNSPKALSEVEIYRKTNNLLSKTRGALSS